MVFFLDENFRKKAALFLNEKGHTSFDIRGTPVFGEDSSSPDLSPFVLSPRHFSE